MISKNLVKKVHQLSMKKFRDLNHQFVAEGPKVCRELLGHATLRLLICTDDFDLKDIAAENVVRVSDDELRKVSFLQHPQQVLAIFDKMESSMSLEEVVANSKDHLTLLLDGVQDPGNMGTIIRVADWFGVENVICSHKSADIWNPKVVQATMGSIARINVLYADLQQLLSERKDSLPVYGTFLNGEPLGVHSLSRGGLLVMGNEGRGISEELRPYIDHPILIPSYPPGRETADSLNVAIATAIMCHEFRRGTTH